MNDARLKLGLVAAFLFVLGSALFWNGLYRGAAEDSREFVDSARFTLLRNGGDAPYRPLSPSAETDSPPRPHRVAPDRPAPPARSSRTVSVKKGDSLYEIADDNLGDGTRWQELARLNDIEPPYLIRPGQVLRLPPPSQ